VSANPDGRLLPGQSARLILSLNTSTNAISIASQALIPSTGGYAVFVGKNGKAAPRPVQIGQRSTGTVEIIEGLSKGDTVIVSNLLRLSPGAAVEFASLK
jgi:membrane fusion protein (multidrug efflux system)